MISNKAVLWTASLMCVSPVLVVHDVQAYTKDSAEMPEANCSENSPGPAIHVLVEGIKSAEGNLRAQIYGSNPEEFLEKGKKLVRVDVPVKADKNLKEGQQYMCVPVPEAGTFALVIMHDKNANGKADIFSEGFGFSNNPKLSLSPPDGEDVMIEVPNGILETNVHLKYVFGTMDESDKRRKLKRR